MTEDANLFEPVGLSPLDEEIYLAVLRGPHRTDADLTTATGHAPEPLARTLRTLENAGLISPIPGPPRRWVPTRPESAIEILVVQRMEQLQRLRQATDALMTEFLASLHDRRPGELIEILGPEAALQRFAQLQQSVTEEMMIFDRPPYVQPGGNPGQPTALARGIRWRAIYAPESLDPPGMPDVVRDLQQAGEQARVLANLPMKLVIADRRIALMPLVADHVIGQTVVVHPSSLLDALITLFESLWERAAPFAVLPPKEAPDAPPEEDRRLIELLAMGLKDDAIARQLGLSTRTMRRRMKRLMDELGVRNRFQAGHTAAKRGWL
ncbi:LuxR C-terminal-related transcriptional regulator [Spirillospora sp. CA-294931]|uniref:LuxR C-terminal-related transcriptional regulator n=1 Tax=Spirillospora sp. CA-294931 TaxID=3240042 RepID=UPI003D935657